MPSRQVVMSNPLGLELAILGNPGPKRAKSQATKTKENRTMSKAKSAAPKKKKAPRKALRKAPRKASRKRSSALTLIPVGPKQATVRVNPRRRVRRNPGPVNFASVTSKMDTGTVIVGAFAVPAGLMAAQAAGHLTRKVQGLTDPNTGTPTVAGRIVSGLVAAAVPVAAGFAVRKRDPAAFKALLVAGLVAGAWAAWKAPSRLGATATRPAPTSAPRLSDDFAGLAGSAEIAAAATEGSAKVNDLKARLAAVTTEADARAIKAEAEAAAAKIEAVNGLAEDDADAQEVAGLAAEDYQDVAGLAEDGEDPQDMAGFADDGDDTQDMAGLGMIVRQPSRMGVGKVRTSRFQHSNIIGA